MEQATAELVGAEAAIGGETVQQSHFVDMSQQHASPSPSFQTPAAPRPPTSSTGANAGSESANPRKRKKASRACDFCHTNHQPCDNGKPKCSVCTKHNKSCLYLRPSKRRGPQKGYRTALKSYRESAAAWGAVLDAIPGLDTLIEGHLRGGAGKAVVASIKDSIKQEELVSKWQQSSVYRAFFGHNGPPPDLQPPDTASTAAVVPSQEVDEEDDGTPPVPPPPARQFSQQPASQRSQSVSSFAMAPESRMSAAPLAPFQPTDSLSDLVAKDAAQSATRASQTLASLGFAPNETIADFYSMGSNPEPIPEPNDPDFDPSLGSEAEQRAYYELLMGRAFPG